MIKTVSWWMIFWWSSSVVRWVPSLIIRIFWKLVYFFFKVCKISSVSLWITSSLLVSLKGLSASRWSCFPSLFSYSWIAEEKCLSESEIWRITNMVIEEIKWGIRHVERKRNIEDSSLCSEWRRCFMLSESERFKILHYVQNDGDVSCWTKAKHRRFFTTFRMTEMFHVERMRKI